ncbi:MAG: TerC family protein [Actinomycetes bacterium]
MTPLWLWAVTVAGILALVALDFLTVSRTPHEVGVGEAARWSVFYIALAVVFGVGVFYFMGSDSGTEFFAAYLVEKSLSVDNLFVFAIILTQFAVPSNLQQRVLLLGIVLALAMRAVFIAIGAAALAYFAFTFVIFGALLIWTGIQLARHRNEDPDPSDNILVRVIRRRFPFTDDYHGNSMFIREQGRRVATPMLLVIIAIGSTDVLFALDSIPATFGVTQDPYLVFTANAFALFGLRALYFLLKGLLDRLVYLSLGLAAILVFIGVKLVLTWAHETWSGIPKIPTALSLVVIAVILAIAATASLIKSSRDPSVIAHAGTVRKPDRDDPAAAQ